MAIMVCIHIYIIICIHMNMNMYINLCSHERACDHMHFTLQLQRTFSLLRDVGSKRGSISSIIDLTTDWSVSISIRSPKIKMKTETEWICLSWIPWDQMQNRFDPRCSERWKNWIYGNPPSLFSNRHVITWWRIRRVGVSWNPIDVQINFEIKS